MYYLDGMLLKSPPFETSPDEEHGGGRRVWLKLEATENSALRRTSNSHLKEQTLVLLTPHPSVTSSPLKSNRVYVLISKPAPSKLHVVPSFLEKHLCPSPLYTFRIIYSFAHSFTNWTTMYLIRKYLLRTLSDSVGAEMTKVDASHPTSYPLEVCYLTGWIDRC